MADDFLPHLRFSREKNKTAHQLHTIWQLSFAKISNYVTIDLTFVLYVFLYFWLC